MEYWDIYDVNKKKTGRTMLRNDWHMQPGEYHLTVLALVRDMAGRTLITRRQLDKEWAAGKWEIPGGGVRAGETSEEAVLREVREETGLVFHNNYFVDIYEFTAPVTAADVRVQKEEVLDFRFARPDEVHRLGDAGDFLHYSHLEAFL